MSRLSIKVVLLFVGIAGVVLQASAYTADAQTLGLWTFNGTPGEAAPTGTVENHVPGATLTCEIGKYTSNNSQPAPDPTYTADVPGAYLWSDAAMTNAVGALSSSVSITRHANNSTSSAYLRMPAFGKLLRELYEEGQEKFTVEFIFKTTATADQLFTMTGTCPVSGAPTLEISPDNGGRISAVTNVSRQVNNNYWRPYTWYTTNYGLYDNRWHHIALTWNGATRKFAAYFEYVYKVDIAKDVGFGLGLDDDSFAQIAGHVYQRNGVKDLTVAAVRVSKGILNRAQMLHVEDAATPSDIISWVRFEDGENGAIASALASNVCHAGMGTYRLQLPKVKVYDVMSRTNEVWKTHVRNPLGATWPANNLCICSFTNGAPSSSVKCLGIMPPETMTGNGFTMEAFIWPMDGNRRIIFRESDNFNGRGIAWALGYRLTNNDLQFGCCEAETNAPSVRVTNDIAETYAGVLTPDTWHHVALTYGFDATTERWTVRVWIDWKKTLEKVFAEGRCLYRSSMASPEWQVGGDGWNGDSLCGRIDEVRFARRALSVDEFLKPTYPSLFLMIR